MKKDIIFFTLGLLGVLSTIDAQDIIGKYASKNSPHSFILNSDSTFIYEYGAFHLYKYSTGTWRMDGKKNVVLNSKIRSTDPSLQVKEFETKNINRTSLLNFSIKVIGDYKMADYKCQVIINDTVYVSIKDGYLVSSGMDVGTSDHQLNLKDFWVRYIRCDSLSSLMVNTEIKSIYFKFVLSPQIVTSTYFSNATLITKQFFPKRNVGDFSIETTLTDSLFYYVVFTDEKLKVKKSSIDLFVPSLNRWQSIAKVSDTKEIFIRH